MPFILKVLKGEKKLLKLKEVKPLTVPKNPAFSAQIATQIIQQDEKLSVYVPEDSFQNRKPQSGNREYLWTVI